MNFNKYLIIFLILVPISCTKNANNITKDFSFTDRFTNKGFTLVFDDILFQENIIDKKMDDRSYFIFQRNLKKNSTVKITNLLNNKSVIAKVKSNKSNYPLFFNSVITKRISEDLEINQDEPYVEIALITNNSSFIAKKTKTWEEEKEVAEKAPIDGIVINDLNKTKVKKKVDKSNKFLYSIKIADFYYKKSAQQMVERIKNETSIKRYKVLSLSKTKFRVILGPFNDINSLKNSYNNVLLLNFENLEIIRYD
tara:strand:- start:17 stop:775 length:759 start_codon:yes stop_codon:yes gene_type:complete